MIINQTIEERFKISPININEKNIADKLKMGDVIEIPKGKKNSTIKVLFLDFKYTRTLDFVGEYLDDYNKWQITEILINYWGNKNKLIIKPPTMILQCIHFPQGTNIYNFPNTIVLKIYNNTLTRNIINNIKN